MTDTVSGILGFLPKKVEEVPLAFWNTIGLGFFLLFSSYSFDIAVLQSKNFEYVIFLSIFLSLVVTFFLMLILGAFKIFIVFFLNHKKGITLYDLYDYAAWSTAGFAIIKYSARVSPPEIIWVIGLVMWALVLRALLFDN